MGTVETGDSRESPYREQQESGTAVRRPNARSATTSQSRETPRVGPGPNEELASFLGWFSVGLGVSQILMPRVVSRICGVEDENTTLMRALGVRELTSGVGILTQRKPTSWLWSRVAGDVMDLALLGKAYSNGENKRGRTTFATAAVLGVLALDVLSAQQLAHSPNTAPETASDGGIHVRKSITVNRPPEEVYAFWHDFENLPRFMRHLESVRVTSPPASRIPRPASRAPRPALWPVRQPLQIVELRCQQRLVTGGELRQRLGELDSLDVTVLVHDQCDRRTHELVVWAPFLIQPPLERPRARWIWNGAQHECSLCG